MMTMIVRVATLVAILGLQACSGPMQTRSAASERAAPSPLVALSGETRDVHNLVIVVPGALSSVHVFDSYLARTEPDTTVVGYRFPGLDGRPLDGRVRIRQAGADIAAYVKHRSPAHVRLIGLSTGGPIVLEAARRISGPDVEVGLVSTALPSPAVLASSAAGLLDIIAAAGRIDAFDLRLLWGEYYRTLLFGRRHFTEPQLAARSADLADADVDRLILPKNGMTRAHGGDLLNWTLDNPQDLSHARILFLHGARDPVFPARGARRLAARLSESKIIVYPRSGHLLFATEPTLFDDLNRAFRTWEGD